DRHYTLQVASEVKDAQGRSLFGEPPGFQTGDRVRAGVPILHALRGDASDRCLVVRFASDDATTAELCLGPRCVDDGSSNGHEIALPLGDDPGTDSLSSTVRAWDETTRP